MTSSYKPDISLKDYINYTETVNCLGFKIINYDIDKIKDYQLKCINDIAKELNQDNDLLKLIDSKIIIPINKSYIGYNTASNVENAEIKNNKLIEIYNNHNDKIKLTNINITNIISFCNSSINKYTEAQLNKRKSDGTLSKKLEKIIYENYTDLNNLKENIQILITMYNFNNIKINMEDINNIIINKIKPEAKYCFDFVLYIFSLKYEEYNKIKERVELRLKIEEENFQIKIEPIIQEKINTVSLRYDLIIKSIIESNERKCNELNYIIKELKENGQQASIELLNILKQKDELENKIKELESHTLEDDDYAFIENLITPQSISELKLRL